MSLTNVNSTTEAPPTPSDQHRTNVLPTILILCLVVLGICILSVGISRAVQYLVNHTDILLPPDMEDDPRMRDDLPERNDGIRPWRMVNSFLSTNNRVGIQITPETPEHRQQPAFSTDVKETRQCTDTDDDISNLSGSAVANGGTSEVQTMHQFHMQDRRNRKEAWGPREVVV